MYLSYFAIDSESLFGNEGLWLHLCNNYTSSSLLIHWPLQIKPVRGSIGALSALVPNKSQYFPYQEPDLKRKLFLVLSQTHRLEVKGGHSHSNLPEANGCSYGTNS